MKQLSQYILEKLHVGDYNPKDDHGNGYVIKMHKDNDEEFFISFQKMTFGRGNVSYIPTYTSFKQNNFRRMKVFKTIKAAEDYFDSYKDKLSSYDEYKEQIEIITYDDAQDLIGDSDKKSKDLKDKQEADRKARRQQRYQDNKEANKKKEEEYAKHNPGTYEVNFPVGKSSWDMETFKVNADSINDAFEKAKQMALKRDPHCNTPGYDHKLTFTKQYIHKK